jgi:zeaxanthin glucosyltransferase
MRLAFGCPAVPGHLHPMLSLALTLRSRGHDVSLIAIPDAEPMARAYGVPFIPVGADIFPAGEMPRRMEALSRLSGDEAVGFTMKLFGDTARALLQDGERAIAEAKPDALVLDATQTGLNLIAIKLGLPFVQVSNALHFDLSGHAPFCMFPWPYEDTPEARARNIEGLKGFGKMLAPVQAVAAEYIEQAGLDPALANIEARSSKLARITQCPKAFDFPGDHLGAVFHYTGPFHATSLRPEVAFPYASMGTLQNGSERVFQAIVAAAEAPGRRLVLSIGRNIAPGQIGPVASNTIVVQSAPQLLLLERATLCITHAGLNTVLESLSAGVPLVAIPITNDQPGVAARITHTATGKVVPLQELSVERLKEAINDVLADASYAEHARALQKEIRQADGLNKAADLIEQTLSQALAA